MIIFYCDSVDHRKKNSGFKTCVIIADQFQLRELTRAWEQDDQQWAFDMKDLFEKINSKVIDAAVRSMRNKRVNIGPNTGN